MIRTSVAFRGIAVARQNDLHLHFRGALNDGIKVIYLEPQQNAVAIWFVIMVCNASVMMLDFETVELEHQSVIR